MRARTTPWEAQAAPPRVQVAHRRVAQRLGPVQPRGPVVEQRDRRQLQATAAGQRGPLQAAEWEAQRRDPRAPADVFPNPTPIFVPP
jgi:hypothetical protein